MLPLLLTVGAMAVQQAQQHGNAKAAASTNRKAAAWNDKNNLTNVRLQGVVLDTNMVRMQTEAADASRIMAGQGAEAKAMARVSAAAMGTSAQYGSYSTVLNSFARKENQGQANILETLYSGLANTALARVQQAFQATTQQNTTQYNDPSTLGAFANFGVNAGAAYLNSPYTRDTPTLDSVSVAPQAFSSVATSPFDIPGSTRTGAQQFL